MCGYAIYHLSRHYPFHTRSSLSYKSSLSATKRSVMNGIRTPDFLATVADANHWATMAALLISLIS